jgi:hypothetical protein
MTLDQIAVFQSRILTDITTGRISPREASAIDRALRNRLEAIERELREAGGGRSSSASSRGGQA